MYYLHRNTVNYRGNFLLRIIKKAVPFIVFLALLAFSISSLVPGDVHAASAGGYMFERTITWDDGTTEHVQIGDDGYFILDGIKKPLIGMDLGIGPSWYDKDRYWLPENLGRIDKILTYLEQSGVRIVQWYPCNINWWGGEPGQEKERYSTVFDLIYKHKMLVMVQIIGKGQENFGQPSNYDFILDESEGLDTMGAFASRWIEVINDYPNVVSVILDNELNIPLEGQTYDSDYLRGYLAFLLDIMRPKIDALFVCNMGDVPRKNGDMVNTCINSTDWPCITHYGADLDSYSSRLGEIKTWLKNNEYNNKGFWIEETNRYRWPGPGHSNLFTIEFLQDAIYQGASVVLMHTTMSPSDPGFSFFDNKGKPIRSMREISASIDDIQVAMSDSVLVSYAGKLK